MDPRRRIEERSLNALPALQTFVYDGWLLRFANGFTKRANSINPLYDSQLPLEVKVAECERLYADQGLPVVFKLTRFSSPANLDTVLDERGYTRQSPTSVQLLDLESVEPAATTGVAVYERVSDHWLRAFAEMNQIKAGNRPVLAQMLQNLIPPACFMLLREDQQAVACGLGVLEDEYLGLFDIVTSPAYRNQGLGAQLVRNLLTWGKARGASTAYLQVVADNLPALRLYAKLGFKEAYQYWYRVRQTPSRQEP
ncbi:MAG TPA: GNAT family N-acetyltransferase [Symbiobacteriaceae bacterium]|jgi:ribosomal protein S18 acetylase RimI-like enzyme